MRLVRLIVSLLAVCAAIVWGLRARQFWPLHVADDKGNSIAGATVLLVREGRVLATSTTGTYGIIKVPISTDSDTAQHLIVCKAEREPAVVHAMAPRRSDGQRPQSYVLLLPARADFETPYIASLKEVLPQECR